MSGDSFLGLKVIVNSNLAAGTVIGFRGRLGAHEEGRRKDARGVPALRKHGAWERA